ncbi:hypothetical protein AVEN_212925-1, partial [Araneus ventricosus]
TPTETRESKISTTFISDLFVPDIAVTSLTHSVILLQVQKAMFIQRLVLLAFVLTISSAVIQKKANLRLLRYLLLFRLTSEKRLIVLPVFLPIPEKLARSYINKKTSFFRRLFAP